ncbi:hypothetical protein DFQ04_2495 [Algoriphagus boseongensis]|uniref:DoxX-like protein n=1 Tax=Algoriphagus boseongensis TaxID=1442587 RepID=A0A4R6T3Y9_9BACT|nr:hypothetical protein [Algoriphagus boseongensis]TDQ16377.1 hypothetical protein DFQ04_2495 [Algoriphagus boseongensis]
MKKFFIQGTSAFLGFTFWGAGMVKLYNGHNFIQWIGPPWLVERLVEFDLGLFAQFIAICQIIIGFMLITTRYKLLGGIMLIPMILNILMVTISQNWRGTPYVLTGLLAMNIFVLWQYRNYFKPILNESTDFPKSIQSSKTWIGHLVWLSGLGLCLASIWVSYQNLVAAFVMAGLGLLTGILSFKTDQHFTQTH